MKPRGFTLVEVMIVIAILGLLAAIAIPNFVKAKQKHEKEVIAPRQAIAHTIATIGLNSYEPIALDNGWYYVSPMVTNINEAAASLIREKRRPVSIETYSAGPDADYGKDPSSESITEVATQLGITNGWFILIREK